MGERSNCGGLRTFTYRYSDPLGRSAAGIGAGSGGFQHPKLPGEHQPPILSFPPPSGGLYENANWYGTGLFTMGSLEPCGAKATVGSSGASHSIIAWYANGTISDGDCTNSTACNFNYILGLNIEHPDAAGSDDDPTGGDWERGWHGKDDRGNTYPSWTPPGGGTTMGGQWRNPPGGDSQPQWNVNMQLGCGESHTEVFTPTAVPGCPHSGSSPVLVMTISCNGC